MVKLFRSLGYLVINCTASRPFDIIVFRNGVHFILELKGKDTRYNEEQEQRQIELCKETGNWFYVIRQSKKTRGRMIISMADEFKGNSTAVAHFVVLNARLWKWREDR
jgi:hypothetical protein